MKDKVYFEPYLDGGTVAVTIKGNHTNLIYYIDNRLKSDTKGRVYDVYPTGKSSDMVDKGIEDMVLELYRKYYEKNDKRSI